MSVIEDGSAVVAIAGSRGSSVPQEGGREEKEEKKAYTRCLTLQYRTQ